MGNPLRRSVHLNADGGDVGKIRAVVGLVEAGELRPTAQPGHGQGWVGPRGDDEVHLGRQMIEEEGSLPRFVVACVGGGSNAMGIFTAFLEDKAVKLHGVEPSGRNLDVDGEHAATITKGQPGIMHGFKSYMLQDPQGEPMEVDSVASGLDYPSVGPEHSSLKDVGRVSYSTASDQEAIDAFFRPFMALFFPAVHDLIDLSRPQEFLDAELQRRHQPHQQRHAEPHERIPPARRAGEPVRIELFGDTVDSLRSFDTDHQRSTGQLDEVVVGPALENPPTTEGLALLARYLEEERTACSSDGNAEISSTKRQTIYRLIGGEFREAEFFTFD